MSQPSGEFFTMPEHPKEVERLLGAGRFLFEQLLCQVNEGIMLCESNPEGLLLRILMVNEAVCKLTGYSQEEWLAMGRDPILLHKNLGITSREKNIIQSSREVILRTALIGKKGDRLPVDMKASSLEQEGIRLILLVVQDLNEQEKLRQIEAYADERDRRYSRMVQVSPEPILFHSEEIIIYANDAAVKLLGAEREQELLGRAIYDFIHADDHPALMQSLPSITFEVENAEFKEYRMIRLDGEIIELEISSIGVFQYLDRPVIQSVLRDVTERKKREQLIRRSEKLLAVGQLSAGLAHEIRNPLTALKGFVQLLKSKTPDNIHYLDIMLAELERINYIIGEFIMLARPSEEKEFAFRNLNTLLNEVLNVMEPQALFQQVEMICNTDDKLPSIYCDERQLKQVFVNIVKNAIEAMSEGGRLWITSSVEDGDKLRLRFTDTGEGIDPAALPRLGEPFYTTKENGSGLGLMVSFRIIEFHQGHMRIETEKGIGTTVLIELPLNGE